MLILKHGSKPIECPTCGCEFVINNPYDVYRRIPEYRSSSLFSIFPPRVYVDYVLCPDCNNKIILRRY